VWGLREALGHGPRGEEENQAEDAEQSLRFH
jgi:hypothetical protein